MESFRTDPSESVRLYVMMTLDIARLPESIPFLAEVLQEGNPLFTPYALRALNGIDTRESRTALWHGMASLAATSLVRRTATTCSERLCSRFGRSLKPSVFHFTVADVPEPHPCRIARSAASFTRMSLPSYSRPRR